jgi:hypothetical protein
MTHNPIQGGVERTIDPVLCQTRLQLAHLSGFGSVSIEQNRPLPKWTGGVVVGADLSGTRSRGSDNPVGV